MMELIDAYIAGILLGIFLIGIATFKTKSRRRNDEEIKERLAAWVGPRR